MNAFADRIKQLVAKGKVHVALKQLQNIDAFDNQLQTQIETLSSRYHQLQNQIINGIVCRNEINLENNRIANSLLLLIDRFPDGITLLEYKLHKLAKSLDISIKDVQTVMNALEERYQSRLYQKMDNYLSLSLQLSYTQEGTDQQFVETFFDEESKGTDFIQKNCLDVLKQHQHLLILGDPGAGKTTLLLQLAINLLQQYEELQIPVIFNLASWTKKETSETSFKEWLQNVLVNGYGFSKEFAAKSLAQNTILPLLDGFDEVGKAYKDKDIQNELRQHCLEGIGQYVYDENVQQFIICSRRREYQAAPQNAPIRAEILISPLSIQQIENALDPQKGIELSNKERTLFNKLKVLKKENHPLLGVLCTPFYFNMIFDTEELIHSLTDYSQLPLKKEEIEHYLLIRFVNKKINVLTHFSNSKTIQYLSWLAHWMNGKDAVSFELADLQPDILKRRWFFGLVGGIFAAFLIGFTEVLAYEMIIGLIGGLIFGLVYGLSLIFSKNLNIQTKDIYTIKWSNLNSTNWKNVIKPIFKRTIQLSLIMVFVVLLIVVIKDGLLEKWWESIIIGLKIGIVYGTALGLVEIFFQEVSSISFFKTIQTPYSRLKSGWKIYFYQVIIVAAFLALPLLSPSIKYDIVLFKTFVFFLLPIVILIFVRIPLIQHFMLRIALTIEKKAPLKYVKFLNAATEVRILEKDGGHWRFRHQLLQDYFAQLYQKD